MAAVPPLDLRPPTEPMLREDGQLSTAWLSYFHALSDRIVAIEKRLAAASIP